MGLLVTKHNVFHKFSKSKILNSFQLMHAWLALKSSIFRLMECSQKKEKGWNQIIILWTKPKLLEFVLNYEIEIYCLVKTMTFSSSYLVVECLDWEGKKQRNENSHNSNNTQVVVSESKVTCYKIFHCFATLKHILYVPKLWSYQSIQCPSNRAWPVVPFPPYWNSLSHTHLIGTC